MSPLEIRTAGPADVPAVVALWREVVEHHAAIRPEFSPTPDAESLHADHLLRGMDSGDRAVFLALVDGAPAGFLSVRPAPLPPVFVGSRTAEITDLGVTRACRRRGVGRALWRSALAWARERGFEEIELGVVAGNDGARRFWAAAGFVPKSERLRFGVGPG